MEDGNPPNYDKLTVEQRMAYDQICESITQKKPAIIAINAPGGSGKTFLLTTLAQRYWGTVQFITYTKREQQDISSKLAGYEEVYTYRRFYMKFLKLSFHEACNLDHTSEADVTKLHDNLTQHAERYCNDETNIIIIDNCTVPPTTMLVLLHILSQDHNIHLIFAGDETQLSPMHTSSPHQQNNFDFIRSISNMTITTLRPIQPCDKGMEEVRLQFRRIIDQNRPRNDDRFYFNLRYYLYCCFRTKYFTDERFDTMFMAQFHQVITNRLYRFIEFLKRTETKYFVEPFYAVGHNVMRPISTAKIGKFFAGLILAEGYKYIHKNSSGAHEVVQLEKIELLEDGSVVSLKVRSLQHGHSFIVRRCQLNYFQILADYREWLAPYGEELIQFPLHPYTITYHAAAGQTMQIDSIELDTNCSPDTISVGLNYRNVSINKIHAEADLPSFVVTDYMRNERNENTYYYRCPTYLSAEARDKIMLSAREKGPNNFIDEIDWLTVDTISSFEMSPRFVRIEVNVYPSCQPLLL